jgi:hypothetical protein
MMVVGTLAQLVPVMVSVCHTLRFAMPVLKQNASSTASDSARQSS